MLILVVQHADISDQEGPALAIHSSGMPLYTLLLIVEM